MPAFAPPGIVPAAAQTGDVKGAKGTGRIKGKGKGKGKGRSQGSNFGPTLQQLQHPSQGLQGLQSLVHTLNCLSGLGLGNLGNQGKSGGKGGKNGRESSSVWESPQPHQTPFSQQEGQQPVIKDETGAPATMLNNQGVEVAVTWVCAQSSCHYPHYGQRQFCSNCKVPRNKAREPTVLITRQIKPRVAPPPLLAATPKAKPAPSQQAGQSEEPVGENAAVAQAGQSGMGDAPAAPAPLHVPACLSAATVKLLIKEGIEVGLKYKETFKVKTLGQSELQEQLVTQQRRLAFLETAPAGDFGDEILVCSTYIKSLEERLGTASDEPMSEIPAPGEESGLVSKLTNLLSRHQVNMAAEESNHKEAIADMEAQIVKLKASLALEITAAQARNAANEELLTALQAKILGLTTSNPHLAAAQQLQVEDRFQTAVRQHFQPSWLQENGLGGMTTEAVNVMCSQFMLMLQVARAGAPSSSTDGTSDMDWTHHASKRNWASQSEDQDVIIEDDPVL